MSTRIGLVGAGWVFALLACGSDHSGGGAWHEPLPTVTVELLPPADTATVLASVEAVPAPPIQFGALLQPDPHHVSPLLAPVTGVLISIAEEHHARRGKTARLPVCA